jgi:glutamate synthase (NADPH) large chain
VDHCVDQLKSLIARHFRSTQSRLAERLLADFGRELAHFWQVVPKEMLDKLEVPASRAAAVALTA